MKTYVGMTSDPDKRRLQWERKGRNIWNFKIINENKPLNYRAAQLLEKTISSDARCPDCESHAGGRPGSSDAYYVYTYNYY